MPHNRLDRSPERMLCIIAVAARLVSRIFVKSRCVQRNCGDALGQEVKTQSGYEMSATGSTSWLPHWKPIGKVDLQHFHLGKECPRRTCQNQVRLYFSVMLDLAFIYEQKEPFVLNDCRWHICPSVSQGAQGIRSSTLTKTWSKQSFRATLQRHMEQAVLQGNFGKAYAV